jgi:hypothetical protein
MMGSEVLVFEEGTDLETVHRESRLLDKIKTRGGLPRIGLTTNGSFRRIVDGEQVGKAVAHQLDVIVVDMLEDVSRVWYEKDYDPDEAAFPDCWSHLGDVPASDVKKAGAPKCSKCKYNIEGSGNKGKGKACRYYRRVAVLIPGLGDELYQIGFASKSLFGDPRDGWYPFEKYKNFLKANKYGPDTVVTRVRYELDDPHDSTMKVKFKAMRALTQEEADYVTAAQEGGETDQFLKLTAFEASAESEAAEEAPVEEKLELPDAPPEAPAGNPFDADGSEPAEEAAPPKAKPRAKAKAKPQAKAAPTDPFADEEAPPTVKTKPAKAEVVEEEDADLGDIVDEWVQAKDSG